ncbi:hypothetical protein JOE09_003440 [Pantoea coffeiphila]|nr:hypothetical protein [Pantoea coffeiphila]
MPQNAINITVHPRLYTGGQCRFSFRCKTDHQKKAPH